MLAGSRRSCCRCLEQEKALIFVSQASNRRILLRFLLKRFLMLVMETSLQESLLHSFLVQDVRYKDPHFFLQVRFSKRMDVYNKYLVAGNNSYMA
ncbi:hypothetical protein Zmor_009414 [Zophobas morio]|uniref:Uncharacterized protein n=1 Tax=Zophobas morio TaxID=2755281 RepID=A0AA38IPA3_9CUCU|nr:hypothetical protein Zmor_009414 [Zophobas morio]